MNDTVRPIVVGVDGRSDDEHVLQWAATEAMSRNLPLRIVHAYQQPVQYEMTPYAGAAYVYVGSETAQSPREEAKAEANRLVTDAARIAQRGRTGLSLESVALEGRAAQTLVEESRSAELVVVGSRRRGAVASTFLGSVGAAVAAGAHAPVVVVRGLPADLDAEAGDPTVGEASLRKPVVVGVDSSALSEDVLAFAFEYAARHRRLLRAVLCWQPRAEYSTAWLAANETDEQSEAALRLSMALSGWSEQYPQVRVERRVMRRPAVRTLVAEAKEANLLVVGAHGRHAVLDRMLGSVSQGVLHQATCPIAVVHARGDGS